MTGAETFAQRLAGAYADSGSLVCVGLDPHAERTPVERIESDMRRVIDLTAPYAAAFKPNSAFYEAHGPRGMAALAAVIAHVPPRRLVILDAKRGDIGSTARAYATAAFDVLGAHALTVSPYLGGDALEPFLERPERGAFVLCHTSNPGAGELQELDVDGTPLYLRVAAAAPGWSRYPNVGLVAGATFAPALAAIRAAAPHVPLLVPGVGAQGGALEAAVTAALDHEGAGILVNSAREVVYAPDPAAAARELRDRIDALRPTAAGARADSGANTLTGVR